MIPAPAMPAVPAVRTGPSRAGVPLALFLRPLQTRRWEEFAEFAGIRSVFFLADIQRGTFLARVTGRSIPH